MIYFFFGALFIFHFATVIMENHTLLIFLFHICTFNVILDRRKVIILDIEPTII